MQELFPYLLNGVSVGGQYALIAIGYTLVYGILRLINFAHGDVFMVAGLVMVYATTAMPMYLALPLVILATVVLGFVIERAAYKPLRTAPRMSLMISAIGVSYLIQNLAFYITGGVPQPVTVPIPWISENILVLGASTKRGDRGDPRPHHRAGGGPGVPDPEDQDRHGHAGRGPGL